MRNMIYSALLLVVSGCGPSASRWSQPAQQAWQPLPVVIQPPAIVQNPWKPKEKARDWRHIVIHHTASSGGSVESVHEAHLGRGWQGIGYHFLIGNGSGMENGEIEPTFRWHQQLHGAHAGNDEYNQRGIGICLVGDFEKGHPSAAQLAAVKRLVGVLKSEYGISSDHVIAHKDVKATACPGKNFPLAEVGQSDALPTLVQYPAVPLVRISNTQQSQWLDYQGRATTSPITDGSH